MSTGAYRLSRFRALEPSGCWKQSVVCRRTCGSSARPVRPMSITASKDGRRFGARPNPYVAPESPPGKINVTDLDSRNVKTPRSYTQGYNVQAVVNEHQIVIAAEVTASSPDFGHLQPMIEATNKELEAVGVSET